MIILKIYSEQVTFNKHYEENLRESRSLRRGRAGLIFGCNYSPRAECESHADCEAAANVAVDLRDREGAEAAGTLSECGGAQRVLQVVFLARGSRQATRAYPQKMSCAVTNNDINSYLHYLLI